MWNKTTYPFLVQALCIIPLKSIRMWASFIYICYIGKDGKPSKPFLLPQEDPDKYDYQLYSYNIPELTKGAVEVSPYEIQQVAEKNKPEQVRFKWPDLFIFAYK